MLNTEIKNALQVLKNGDIILYPTDTVWCIGCDATLSNAVDKIIEIKKITSKKGFIVLLDNENKLQSYVSQVPEIAYNLIEYTEKPLTIIYSGAKNLAPNVIAPDGSVGIRIVKHNFCQQLIQQFRKPLVSTSANFSGSNLPKIFMDISPELLDMVDYVVNLEQNDVEEKLTSTIMKLEADGKFEFVKK